MVWGKGDGEGIGRRVLEWGDLVFPLYSQITHNLLNKCWLFRRKFEFFDRKYGLLERKVFTA